jgi:hypothetical protein
VEEGEVVVVEEVEVGAAGEEVVEVDFRKSTGAVIHIYTGFCCIQGSVYTCFTVCMKQVHYICKETIIESVTNNTDR